MKAERSLGHEPADPPELSIVVLTYNRRSLLGDCLASLLEQTVPAGRLEIIVADDGSTDGTEGLVAEVAAGAPHLRYFRQPHRGIPAVRNLGISGARGRIVAMVADDYLLPPDYAATVLRFFDEQPGASIVRFEIVAAGDDLSSRISHFYYRISFLNRLHPRRDPPPGRWSRLGAYFRRIPLPEATITTEHDLEASGAAAFRGEVFATVGLFDESLLRAEDTDLTRRLAAAGIPVHYYPFLKVSHQYAFACVDTIGKCFNTGLNRYRLHRKYVAAASVRVQAATVGHALADQFLRSIWRARQASAAWKFVAYFPAMLVFESAVKAGFFWGALRSALGPRATR
jgi:glycosyltransferase involved in cell wall biosynthesis